MKFSTHFDENHMVLKTVKSIRYQIYAGFFIMKREPISWNLEEATFFFVWMYGFWLFRYIYRLFITMLKILLIP